MVSPPSCNVPREFSLAHYHYDLPAHLIAQRPAEPRDSSRLLVLHREAGGKFRIEHRKFLDLPEFLAPGDLLVANNTRVIRARLLGHRLREEDGRWVEGGKAEFVLLEPRGERQWEGLFKASARYVRGLRFRVPTPDGQGLEGTLVRGSDESPSGTVVAEFNRDPLISGAGEIPLPHYIERAPEGSDDSSYQTLYAKTPGSAAAPTAGLHFTDRAMQALRARGVDWAEITLHVGLGTFRPVKTPDVRSHVMHEERYEIPPDVATRIARTRADRRRIVAVGTTAVRTLESAAEPAGRVRAGEGRTSIFIRPGAHEFRAVDAMLTNFHLPGSTLLMLVSAFAGHEAVMEAYRQAVSQEYRFFSYGDAMLIL